MKTKKIDRIPKIVLQREKTDLRSKNAWVCDSLSVAASKIISIILLYRARS